MRSVYLQKNKAIFDVSALPLQEFAESLGLAGAPKIKFVGRELAKKRKNASRDSAAVVAKDDRSGSGGGSSDEEGGGDGDKSTIEKDAGTKVCPFFSTYACGRRGLMPTQVRTKYDRMFERKNQSVLSSHYTALIDQSSDSDADEFISLKRANHDLDIPSLPSSSNLSNRQLKAGQSKRQMLKYKGAPSKLVFDDEGEGHEVYEMKDDEEFRTGGVDVREEGRKFAEVQRMKMGVADVVDKEEAKGKKRERKEKKKRAARGQVSYREQCSASRLC